MIYNIWTYLFVCFAAFTLFFPYIATKKIYRYTRSSSHALPLITFIPIKLLRTESGKGRGDLLYPGLRTRLHRMVTANGPSPDTYTLIFISAGFLWIPPPISLFSLSLSLFLPPLWLTLRTIQIVMHDVKHGCDYVAISRYESLNPVNVHHCSHDSHLIYSYAYFWSFPLQDISSLEPTELIDTMFKKLY